MIASETSSISYSGNASTSTAYAIPFAYLDSAHIAVTVTDSGGTSTALTNGTHFTVTNTVDGDGNISGGSLVTATAYPSTSTVAIKRDTPITQPVDFVTGGGINEESLETALDRQTMILQETYRDATGDQVSGIVAAGRTISAATGSGLSVTNGDGEAGNPTIDNDSSALSTVETVSTGAKIRTETTGGDIELIEVDDMLGALFPIYRQIELPHSVWNIGGGASGITDGGDYFNFTDAANGSGITTRFVLPRDYAGGDVTFKVHSYILGGTPGEAYVLKSAVYNAFGAPPYSTLVGDIVTTTLTHSAGDCRSADILLAESGDMAANGHYFLVFWRDGANAADTSTGQMRISHISVEYQATRRQTAWT